MTTIPCAWRNAPSTSSYLEELFTTLSTDKALPKFQFERRVDCILRVFLPELLSKILGGDVVVIVPEFPLKKADSSQSTNIDYLLFRRAPSASDERWLFLELKTDSGSIRAEQFEAYLVALSKGMPRLLEDLDVISEASKARGKYAKLRERLRGQPAGRPIELVVLTPRREDVQIDDPRVRVLTFQDLVEIPVERFVDEWALFCKLFLAPAFNARRKATTA